MNNLKQHSIGIVIILMAVMFFNLTFFCDNSYAASKSHLKKTSITLITGESYQQKLIAANGKTIKATKVKWSTSKKSVAQISKKGKVTTKKEGKVTLKAKYKGKTYKFRVIIKNATLRNKSIILTTGESYEQKLFNAAKKAISSNIIQYKSGNTGIATIDKRGCITAKKSGSTYITAIYKGKTYKFNVVVKDAKLASVNINIYAGDSFQQKLYDAKGTVISPKQLEFNIADSQIAAIDGNGTITAKQSGSTRITTKYMGKTYSATLSVNSRFSLSCEEIYVYEDEPQTILLTELKYSPNYVYKMNVGGYVDGFWGDWDNNVIPLTLYAKKTGTVVLNIYAKSAPYDVCSVIIHSISSYDSEEQDKTESRSAVCSNALPHQNRAISILGEVLTVAEIESVELEVSDSVTSNLTIKISGRIVYCADDWAMAHYAYFRVLDEEGYEVTSHYINTNEYKVGATFKVKEQVTISNPKGEYTVEFFDK